MSHFSVFGAFLGCLLVLTMPVPLTYICFWHQFPSANKTRKYDRRPVFPSEIKRPICANPLNQQLKMQHSISSLLWLLIYPFPVIVIVNHFPSSLEERGVTVQKRTVQKIFNCKVMAVLVFLVGYFCCLPMYYFILYYFNFGEGLVQDHLRGVQRNFWSHTHLKHFPTSVKTSRAVAV